MALDSCRDRPGPGGCYVRRWRLWGTMRWRIMLELAGPDGTPQRHEVGSGERSPTGHTAATLGLGLEEGKAVLAAVQRHLLAAGGACQRSCRSESAMILLSPGLPSGWACRRDGL